MDLADGIGHGFSACEIGVGLSVRAASSRRLPFPPAKLVSGFAGRQEPAASAERQARRGRTLAFRLDRAYAPLPVRLAAALRAVPYGGVDVFDPQLRAGGEHPLRAGPRPAVPAREVPARQSGGRSAGAVQTPCGRSGRMRRASSRKAWISCLKPPRPLRRIWRVR